MMNPIRSLLFPALLLTTFAGAELRAQCPFQSVTLQSYGNGCSEVFGFDPTLGASLDTANCRLTLTVEAYSGCCNTFLQATFLIVGFQGIAVPLPLSDPTCGLFVTPDLVFAQLGWTPGEFSFPLPPGLPPVTLNAQGIGSYLTTVHFPNLAPEYSLTAGYVVDLQ